MPISMGSKCPFCPPLRTPMAPHHEKGSSTNVGKLIIAKKVASWLTPYRWRHNRCQKWLSPPEIFRWLRPCNQGRGNRPPHPPAGGGPQPRLGAPPQLQYFYCFTFLILKITIYISMIKCHGQLARTGGGHQLNHPRHFLLYQGLNGDVFGTI